MSTITYKKSETWQCKKCNEAFAVVFDSGTPENDVFLSILDLHKKKSGDCSAPSGFEQVRVFMKHTEIK